VAAVFPHDPPVDEGFAIQCAILHDVLEDTATTREALVTTFGEAMAAGVEALTKNHDLPEVDRMADSLCRIQTQPREVWMVKLADRITNLQPPPPFWHWSKVIAYADEAEEILEVLGGASGALASRLRDRIVAYRGLVTRG
jgi:(p)ppGpp synthase/HD superfamily hydrolase